MGERLDVLVDVRWGVFPPATPYSQSVKTQVSTSMPTPTPARGYPTPGDSQSGAVPLQAEGSLRSVMRSASDEQWWAFTAHSDGTYAVGLSELPYNYSLTVHHSGGSGSSSGSGTGDRVRTVTLRAGEGITVKVSASTGGLWTTSAYLLTVSAAG